MSGKTVDELRRDVETAIQHVRYWRIERERAQSLVDHTVASLHSAAKGERLAVAALHDSLTVDVQTGQSPG